MFYEEERPWGKFEQYTHNDVSTVKILTLKKDEMLSLQSHEKRDELWVVIEGDVKIVIDDKTYETKPGDRFEIKRGQKHRIIGPGRVLEVSFGEFDENDEIRYEDKYGRLV